MLRLVWIQSRARRTVSEVDISIIEPIDASIFIPRSCLVSIRAVHLMGFCDLNPFTLDRVHASHYHDSQSSQTSMAMSVYQLVATSWAHLRRVISGHRKYNESIRVRKNDLRQQEQLGNHLPGQDMLRS